MQEKIDTIFQSGYDVVEKLIREQKELLEKRDSCIRSQNICSDNMENKKEYSQIYEEEMLRRIDIIEYEKQCFKIKEERISEKINIIESELRYLERVELG